MTKLVKLQDQNYRNDEVIILVTYRMSVSNGVFHSLASSFINQRKTRKPLFILHPCAILLILNPMLQPTITKVLKKTTTANIPNQAHMTHTWKISLGFDRARITRWSLMVSEYPVSALQKTATVGLLENSEEEPLSVMWVWRWIKEGMWMLWPCSWEVCWTWACGGCGWGCGLTSCEMCRGGE